MAIPDYSLGMVQPSQVGQSFSRGVQDGIMLGESAQASQDRARLIAAQDAAAKMAADKAAQEAAAKAQQQADFVDLVVTKGLDKDASLAFAAKHPSAIEQLTKTLKLKSDAEQKQYIGQAQTLLSAGASDPKRASKIAKEYADAHRNTPGMKDQTEALDKLSEQLLSSTDTATTTLSSFLAGAMDPKEYADTLQKVSQAQALAKKAGADADKAAVDARFANDKALADLGYTRAQTNRLYAQSKNDADRLGLDRERLVAEKLAAENALRLEAGRLPEGVRKDIDAAVDEAAAAKLQAEVSGKLAKAFAEEARVGNFSSSGARAWVGDKIGAFAGIKTDAAQLREQHKGLIGKLVVSNLPPGAASDADIDLVRGGFPSENTDPADLAKFHAAMEKVQRAVYQRGQLKSSYLAKNGSLAPARADMVVQGIPVRAGETFDQAGERYFAGQSPAQAPQQVETSSARAADSLFEEYPQ